MDEKHFITWVPGGCGDGYTLQGAREEVERIIRVGSAFYWEVRTPGVNSEDTWQAGGEALTLKGAVNRALPGWDLLGLDLVTAAILAMNAGLVLSTGWRIEEDEEV